jgi:thiol-disulfide isomerase/thioredoxin
MEKKTSQASNQKVIIKYIIFFLGFIIFSMGLAFFRATDHGKSSEIDSKVWIQGSKSKDLLEGQPTILYFWATWCSICKINDPFLKVSLAGIQSRGVNFISVEEGSKSKEELNQFLKVHNIDYPVLIMSSEQIQKFFVTGYPTTIFIDKDGIIRFVDSGILNPISFWLRLWVTKIFS